MPTPYQSFAMLIDEPQNYIQLHPAKAPGTFKRHRFHQTFATLFSRCKWMCGGSPLSRETKKNR